LIKNKVVAQFLRILATLSEMWVCATVLHIVVKVWCDRKGVVTSPRIKRYSDASASDLTSELTFEKKPKR